VQKHHHSSLELVPQLSRLLVGFLIMALLQVESGCAAWMLATGDNGSDMSTVQPGVSLDEAERLLRSPVTQWVSSTGITYRVYEYDTGSPPNLLEAWHAAIFSFITMGIAEPFLISNEVARSRKELTYQRVNVSVDAQGVILGIFDEFEKLPENGISGPRQWNK